MTARTFPLSPAFAALDRAAELLNAAGPSGYSMRHDPRVHEAQELMTSAILLARSMQIDEPTLYRLRREAR